MMTSFPSSLSSSSLLQLLLISASSWVSFGISRGWIFQSGPDHGNSYGSSIQFDGTTNRLYVTGSTYGSYWGSGDDSDDSNNSDSIPRSTCFLSIFNWGSDDTSTIPWTTRKFASPNGAPESCKQILVTPTDSSSSSDTAGTNSPAAKVLLLGNTRPQGSLSELYPAGTTINSPQYGMILDVDIHDTDNATTDAKETMLLGGRLLQDGKVLYPMGMVTKTSATRGKKVAAAAATDDLVDDYDGLYSYSGGDLFVVSMQSFDERQNHQRVNDAAIIDLTNPENNNEDTDGVAVNVAEKTTGRNRHDNHLLEEQSEPDLNQVLQYGSSYNLLVERFFSSYDDYVEQLQSQEYGDTTIEDQYLTETWIDTWRKPYSVHHDIGVDGTTVHVAGVTTFDSDSLIIMGSTAGQGSIFGTPSHGPKNEKKKNDVDGFVTLLSQSDGSYQDKSIRIESSDSQDDYITGFCQYDSDLYIVGTTHGQIDTTMDTFVKGEIHAYVMNIDLITFRMNWVKQIGGESLKHDEVHGIACEVTENGKRIYFGGTVKNGASLALYGETSSGLDDIFLVQAATATGRMNYIRQWGTSYNDRLMDITTDKDGNAILLGNTDGSIVRHKHQQQGTEQQNLDTTDIFIVLVDKHAGSMKEPLNEYHSGHIGSWSSNGNNNNNNNQTWVNHSDNSVDHLDTTASPDNNENDPSSSLPQPSSSSSSSSNTTTGRGNNSVVRRIVYVVVYLVFFWAFFAVLYKSRRYWMACLSDYNDEDKITDRKEVLKYLYNFDVDDIDLKHSATGGWHCNYTNDLAEGINSRNPTGLFPGWRHPPPAPQDSGILGRSGKCDPYTDTPTTTTNNNTSKNAKVMDPLIVRDQHIDSLFFDEDQSRKEREQLQSVSLKPNNGNDDDSIDGAVDALSDDGNTKPWVGDQQKNRGSSRKSTSRTDETKERWGTDII